MYDRIAEVIIPLFQSAINKGLLKQESGEKAMIWYAALFNAATILNTYTRTDVAALLIGGLRPLQRDESIDIILSIGGFYVESDGFYYINPTAHKNEASFDEIVAQIKLQVNAYLRALHH